MYKMEPELLDVRKIDVQTTDRGNTTYKITLPVEWVRKNKLEKGGRLVVSEDNGRLVIQRTTATRV